MTESQFADLRTYVEASGSCIDMGYRPMSSLIRKGWLREIVPGCWQITESGLAAFNKIIAGEAELTLDRGTA